MSDVESGVSFFVAGVNDFAQVPPAIRPFVFQVCARQMILSATAANETFQGAPGLAREIDEAGILGSIYQVAAEISRRSSKHSAEFLNAAPVVVASLLNSQAPLSGRLSPADPKLRAGSSPPLNKARISAAIELAKAFAEHAGGIAADAWASLPGAIDRLSSEQSLRLMRRAMNFLERK